ncbi:MAG: HGGxSTG domain-containing protein [Bryobacteraceae bacterium]
MKGVFTGTRGILWGPGSKVQRCLARTRHGTPCQRPAEINPLTGKRSRCRFHGGLAGCRTAEGKARISAANTKHGRFTKAAKEKLKAELEAKRADAAIRRAELAYLQAENARLKKQLSREKQELRPSQPTLLVIPEGPP